MKKMLMCFLIALTTLVVQAQMGEKMSGVDKEITNMEEQWAAAGKTGKAEVVSPMLADNFVNLNSDGTMIDKSKTLENIKKSKWEINQISDVKVTTFGEYGHRNWCMARQRHRRGWQVGGCPRKVGRYLEQDAEWQMALYCFSERTSENVEGESGFQPNAELHPVLVPDGWKAEEKAQLG